MERKLSAYLRQSLALCFVLAGLLTFAEQAHCLTMTQAFAASQAMDQMSNSHHNMAMDDHDCPYKDGCKDHPDWTFLQQHVGTSTVPHLRISHAYYGQMLPAQIQMAALAAGHKPSPPNTQERSGRPSVLTTTGQLLI